MKKTQSHVLLAVLVFGIGCSGKQPPPAQTPGEVIESGEKCWETDGSDVSSIYSAVIPNATDLLKCAARHSDVHEDMKVPLVFWFSGEDLLEKIEIDEAFGGNEEVTECIIETLEPITKMKYEIVTSCTDEAPIVIDLQFTGEDIATLSEILKQQEDAQ